MKYKYLLIDNDDTIMDFTLSEYESIGRSLQKMGLPDSDEIRRRYSAINQACWKDFEKGLLPRERIPLRRFEELLASLGREEDEQEVLRLASIYENELAHSAILLPGAREFLERANKRLCLCIITNGSTKIQTTRFSLSGLDKLTKNIFISQVMGVQKPNKEYFEAVFKAVGVTNPAEVLTVGDSLSSDIAGGKNAGTPTCLFDRHNSFAGGNILPDFIVHSFEELESLLGF